MFIKKAAVLTLTLISSAAMAQMAASDTQTLTDAGLEVGMKFTQLIDATLGYAKSIQDKNISAATKDASDARLYFRVSIKI